MIHGVIKVIIRAVRFNSKKYIFKNHQKISKYDFKIIKYDTYSKMRKKLYH